MVLTKSHLTDIISLSKILVDLSGLEPLHYSFAAIVMAADCNVRETAPDAALAELVSEWAGHYSVAITLTGYLSIHSRRSCSVPSAL